MDTLLELVTFLRENRKTWLLPLILLIALISGLVILVNGSVVAPFIYALF